MSISFSRSVLVNMKRTGPVASLEANESVTRAHRQVSHRTRRAFRGSAGCSSAVEGGGWDEPDEAVLGSLASSIGGGGGAELVDACACT